MPPRRIAGTRPEQRRNGASRTPATRRKASVSEVRKARRHLYLFQTRALPSAFRARPIEVLDDLSARDDELLTAQWERTAARIADGDRLPRPDMWGFAERRGGRGTGIVILPRPEASPEAWLACFVARAHPERADEVGETHAFLLEAGPIDVSEPAKVGRWDGSVHTTYSVELVPDPDAFRAVAWQLSDLIASGREDEVWVTRSDVRDKPGRGEVHPTLGRRLGSAVVEEQDGRFFFR